MAILDNSGDIILDAVLTDEGRRRMAQGSFQIVKFALGDDEIDYRLYNRQHPSGSAYYDLEILQTPVFESVTSQNSAINYGLLSITNPNLLYMPIIKVNQNFSLAVNSNNNIFYLAANSETKTKLNVASALGTDGKKLLTANTTSDTQLLYLESGLDTTDLAATAQNRATYLANNDLLDFNLTVQVDSRFISQVMGPSAGQSFSAPSTSDVQTIPNSISIIPGGTNSMGLINYVDYSVPGLNNLLYAPVSTTRTDSSVITGPRGIATMLNFGTILNNDSSGVRPVEYTRYGKIEQNLFGNGDNYDYIDTNVNIIGNSSTIIAQIPIRLIRYVS